jgi:hypothetical protein
MAIGKSDPEWQKKFKIWQASGKSASEWCKENNIPLQTFYTWKKRLKAQNQTRLKEQVFVELKNKSSDSVILLEYKGFKIHLSMDFDVVQLKRCLAALKDAIC